MTSAILRDLARAKCTFQTHALETILTEVKDMTQSKPDQMSEARELVERLTGHTPGPWRNADGVIQSKTKVTHPDGRVEWTFKYARIIAEVAEDWDYILNGNLIAAAPDLHAALTAALDEIETLDKTLTTAMQLAALDLSADDCVVDVEAAAALTAALDRAEKAEAACAKWAVVSQTNYQIAKTAEARSEALWEALAPFAEPHIMGDAYVKFSPALIEAARAALKKGQTDDR